MDWKNNIISGGIGYLRSYLTGRGLVSLGVIAASFIGSATGFGLLPAAIVAGVGGIIVTTLSRLSQQRVYEGEMLNLYRREIAAEFGRAPEQLTREDLYEAAKTNQVIEQALRRQEHKTAIEIATEALAAVVTVALLGFMGHTLVGYLKNTAAWATNLLGNSWGLGSYLVGIGTVAGFSSLIVHDGLGTIIGQATGVSKAAAHDRILEMQRGLEQGKATTPQQVYGVIVAGDPALAQSIAKQFHKLYAQMNVQQQQEVLKQFGVIESTEMLAREINTGMIEPGKLAYMIGEEHAMRHKAAEPDVSTPQKHVAMYSFVEKLGLSHRGDHSHRARVEASRVGAVTSQHMG